MSDIGYNRCPRDNWRAASAVVGVNPLTGKPIEVGINGISAVTAIQSALSSLTTAMKAGHEEDFLEKVVLALLPGLKVDPHILCPMLTILGEALLLLQGTLEVGFDGEGNVVFHPPGNEDLNGHGCMFEDCEGGEEDVDNEGNLGEDGSGFGGTSDEGGKENGGGSNGMDGKDDGGGIRPN